ncbi:UDP-N-acetylmuramate dehydrogenase [Campylobacter sp. faydin G-24]|uniref:UDP-N-acetylenolpyruvoylglucosamine reductase n=1 Tax=Campylobacter anatolicus TaxID=2829105 RepID=A0ABS5HH36_9BACT|nr:UDP-N-acetylmuramate dehydrogenase [Campylobacter anatolicus]MBR8463325.1 UDP-N-acetylmuramate dehydrogenase [Campylobacter anatolicus]MBR8465361.1 UDP-N-acetylmuramate dehydrogenase [Campylobacter anatolicus]
MTRVIDFTKFSSVRIGGVHEVAVINSPVESLCGAVLIGGANNLLVSPNPPKMAILGDAFDYINLNGDELEIGAAIKSSRIYNFAKQHNIANFEFLKNIPGTLGGLVKMNAGLCGFSISDTLTQVHLGRGWVSRDEIGFSYRFSSISEPIFGAKFKVKSGFSEVRANEFATKRSNQPRGASFGSCFVNPSGDYAGRLLEAVGLKGHIIGGAKFSEQHANFLINFNNATFDDAMSLISLAKELVLVEFGVELKTEVVVL